MSEKKLALIIITALYVITAPTVFYFYTVRIDIKFVIIRAIFQIGTYIWCVHTILRGSSTLKNELETQVHKNKQE